MFSFLSYLMFQILSNLKNEERVEERKRFIGTETSKECSIVILLSKKEGQAAGPDKLISHFT